MSSQFNKKSMSNKNLKVAGDLKPKKKQKDPEKKKKKDTSVKKVEGQEAPTLNRRQKRALAKQKTKDPKED